MAKLQQDAITAEDLEDFVANDSDFAFEMKVLAQLRHLEFSCDHSGTYQDPVSAKIRQFDIRAEKKKGKYLLALAVECKNLRSNCPLLVSSVPRTARESFHDVIVFRETAPIMPSTRIDTFTGERSAYKLHEMVGKKTDQVGRDTSGAFVSDDSATFEKLNQSVNSCRDLVEDLASTSAPPYIRAILPVLVVPTGLLWQVDYANDGKILAPPRCVETATLFLNHSWRVVQGFHGPLSYCLSHIELVTLSALPNAVKAWMGSTGFFFPFWGT